MNQGPHILICSESGTGKSTFAASSIAIPPQVASGKPVLVQGFDPADKMTPYRKRGDRIVLEKWEYGEREHVFLKNKEVAIIERWHEKQGRGSAGVTMRGGTKVDTMKYVLQGEVWAAYLERMKHFVAEAEDEYWAYIHDSTTFAEHAARAYLTGVMKVADGKMVWAQATDELEHFYLATFPDLPITTIVISHAVPERVKERDEQGKMTRSRGTAGDVPYEARLPGRLANDLFSTFGEIYRGYIEFERNEETRKKGPAYYMQTQRDEVWRCQSQLGVPSPIGPNPKFKEVYEKVTKYEEQ